MKIVQLHRSGKKYKVKAYTDFDLPKGIIVNDVIMDEKSLIQNIHTMLRHVKFGKLEGNYIAASIPESKAFVRVINIPVMNEEQAENAVPIEAEQYIPIPLDQAYLDWEVIGQNDERMDVLVMACPKDYIDNWLRVLKNAGLRPVYFEVESAACARALISPEKRGRNTLILDMDTYRTSLIVADQGSLQFTSSVPIAGDAFTQSIARALAIKPEEAEQLKRQFGVDDSRENAAIQAALAPIIDNLIAEIKNTIKFHDEHASKPIEQIIMCGGSAKLLHLSSYLYKQLAEYNYIDIVLGNPWVNIFDAGQLEAFKMSREDSLSYTTAIGLAMRAAHLK